MSLDIYYYSGTGNSVYVAREFQKRIPEANLIPIDPSSVGQQIPKGASAARMRCSSESAKDSEFKKIL